MGSPALLVLVSLILVSKEAVAPDNCCSIYFFSLFNKAFAYNKPDGSLTFKEKNHYSGFSTI